MNSITITRVNAQPTHAHRFYCGRGSPLGNPHVMRNNSLTERNRVCDAFAAQFPSQAQMGYLERILAAYRATDIELACFCAPLRCHCETIRDWLQYERADELDTEREDQLIQDSYFSQCGDKD